MSGLRSTVEPRTYIFRVRLLGGLHAPRKARQIWRDIELLDTQTLADLGFAIPEAFDFDDPHLWAFFLSGTPWDRATEYTYEPEPNLADEILEELFGERELARPAEGLSISEVPAGKEFLYIFDFGDQWHFGIKLTRTSDILELGVRYPRVVARHRESPPQYPELQDDLDDDEGRSS